jgi:hypothetical protein
LYEIGDYQGSFEAICRATRLSSQTDVSFLHRLSARLAKCLTQGARGGAISDEAIINESEVIEHLKGLASENTGATKELQFAWNEWDLVRDEATGDRVERKRSPQLNLAGMDFRRQKLYVRFVRHPNTKPLKGTRREYSMEYFHVCPNLACLIYVSQQSVCRRAPMRSCPWRTDGAATKMSLSASLYTLMNNCPR